MIANKTTNVPVEKTVFEIQSMLAAIKASSLMVDYENGEPSAIAFKLNRNGNPISFRLPSNWQGILRAMEREKLPKSKRTPEQAKRVSWRVVRDWLRAQLTMVEAGASTIEEVMIPWAITNDGTTVGVRLLSQPNSLIGLPAPKGES